MVDINHEFDEIYDKMWVDLKEVSNNHYTKLVKAFGDGNNEEECIEILNNEIINLLKNILNGSTITYVETAVALIGVSIKCMRDEIPSAWSSHKIFYLNVFIHIILLT